MSVNKTSVNKTSVNETSVNKTSVNKTSVNETSVNETVLEELKYLQSHKGFVGREFLTWVWFKSETSHHQFFFPKQGGRFQLFIDDKLTLTSTSGSVHEHTLKGGTPAYATEAKAALLTGKLVQEAKFVLQTQDRQWMFSLNAEDLSFKNVRLPAILQPESASYMGERIGAMRTLVEVIEILFCEYMDLRTSAQFEAEKKAMEDWLTHKQTINMQ
jgi:hypothetical protein